MSSFLLYLFVSTINYKLKLEGGKIDEKSTRRQ